MYLQPYVLRFPAAGEEAGKRARGPNTMCTVDFAYSSEFLDYRTQFCSNKDFWEALDVLESGVIIMSPLVESRQI